MDILEKSVDLDDALTQIQQKNKDVSSIKNDQQKNKEISSISEYIDQNNKYASSISDYIDQVVDAFHLKYNGYNKEWIRRFVLNTSSLVDDVFDWLTMTSYDNMFQKLDKYS